MAQKGINHLIKVSPEDVDLLQNHVWSRHGGSKSRINHLNYARRITGKSEGKTKRVVMHRVILERVLGRTLDRKEHVDHIDYDGLNNRRDNLRIVTVSQNIGRARLRQNNTSGCKGASWSAAKHCWIAQITHGGTVRGIGAYKTKEEAAIAYDAVARFIRRGFA